MRPRLKEELTTKEMQLAKLLVDGWKHEAAAEETGIGLTTVRRRIDEPNFIEYMDRLREAAGEGFVETAKKKSYELADNFSEKDALEFYLEMSKTATKEDQVRLQAMKEAVALYISKRAPGGTAEQPEKATFYKAEWMTQ